MTKKKSKKPIEIKLKGSDNLDKIYNQEAVTIRNDFLKAYKLKQAYDSVPTYTPNNFFEQFYFYENGATRRLYININGTWRYSTLT